MRDELGRLAAWVINAGGHHDGVELRRVDGRRCLVAVRPIAMGTELARVPRSLMITREVVEASAIGRHLRDVGESGVALSCHHALVAAWLLVERRRPDSPYHPYFDCLPRALPGFPIYASPADLALLDGSLVTDMLDELRADLAADHAALDAHAQSFGAFDRDELVWARLCVGARGFGATIDGAETSALVPFIDMLDHRPGIHTQWGYDRATESFRLVSLRSYDAGEEVFNSYGPKPNARLLVCYGFCTDDSRADEAVLQIPSLAAPVHVTRDLGHESSQRLIGQLLAQHRGEAGARAVLAAAARAALARFPTTIADDDALLAGALSLDARNFITMRRGEKRVLQTWLDLATIGPSHMFGATLASDLHP